jgi:hypothetical protein
MKDMLQLFNACKCAVHITCNQHKNYYESVEQYMEDNKADCAEDVLSEMIKRDTVIEIQYYPITPVGFNIIYHYDLETALKAAIESIK